MNISGRVSLVNVDLSHYSATVFVLSKITKTLHSINVQKKLPLTNKSSKKKNKLSGFLFYFISALIVSNEKSMILLLIVFMGMMLAKFNKSKIQTDKDIVIPPKLKFYIWWSLRFLSPLQKYMQYLANKYDGNPIIYMGTGLSMKKNALCL